MRKLNVKNDGRQYEVPALSTIEEVLASCDIKVKDPIAGILNGQLVRLDQKIRTDSSLSVVSMSTPQGKQIYESSVLFLFLVAFKTLYPNHEVFIQHTIQRGIYAEISGMSVTPEDVEKVKKHMMKLVERQLPIEKVERDWDEVMESMKERDRNDMINLFRYHHPTKFEFFELEGVDEFLYLPIVPNTSYLKWFNIQKYRDGVVILLPDFKENKTIPEFVDRPKIFNSFLEYNQWSQILKVRTVGQLNKYIMNDEIGDLIKVAEALHEKKVAQIADQITKRDHVPRLVAIAGPSSSGKTTFSKRLEIQLRVNGYMPVTIGMDNYFVDREFTPRDEDGNYDFEDIKAIDVNLFSGHINDLLQGKEIELPRFDFQKGRKFPSGEKMKLEANQIIVFEGIHGLNPLLTSHIPREDLFKIYIAPLTQLNIHRHDRIAAADTRLLRRMVRDNFFRGYSAVDTLSRWASVRRGEKKNIFPLQEEADTVFNSALFYELSVLKPYAERELLKVTKDCAQYPEAQRLLRFLSFFMPLHTNETPSTSILKEFIGGSTFEY